MVFCLIALSVSLGWMGYVAATPAPSRTTIIEPGFSGFCTDMIYTDGTTPIDHPTNGGANTVGTTGQDQGTFLTAILANNKAFCYEPGIYTFTSTVTISQSSVSIFCSSIGENAAGTTGTILRRSGNGDLFDSTGPQFQIRGCQLDTTATQASGIGLSLAGFNARVEDVNVGNIVSGQQFFWIGILVSSQNSFLHNLMLSNCVNMCIQIDVSNVADERVDHVVIENWGANIFARNPVGISLNSTLATFLDSITISQCDPAIAIIPGTGKVVTETFFSNLNLDSNWGAGIVAYPTSNGIIKQLHWTNIWVNTNLQKASATENGGVNINGVTGITWAGGEVAGNPWEGVIINGTNTKNIFMSDVNIENNNPTAKLGAQGTFGSSNTPGLYINAANLNFTMIGGSVGNPNFGTPGKQGGIYITNVQNAFISGVNFQPSVANGKYGLSTGTVLLLANPGMNPQPVRSVTAGASVYTFTDTDSVLEQLQLTTVNGLSSWTCRGITMSNTVLTYSPVLYPGQSCAITWVTTAPIFEVYPQ